MLGLYALLAGVIRVPAATNETAWWSLRAIVRPAVPELSSETAYENLVDRFILKKLEEQGLGYSPQADRRTLIRRLYFDLIGLPPPREEIEQFNRNDDPQAYEKLVDRLLASPRYGERWARHWLDVVHYGDTHGYDKDQPRPNAWPYRDYVIRALNEDMPYAQFVTEQIAADATSDRGDAVEALGFIAAGPWDLIGHAEVAETKIDGKIARHLDRDDMVANTMSTFSSMTVHCAQCHDHKFDPISAEDYYSLQAVFAAVDRTNIEYYSDATLTKKRKRLKQQERELEAERKTVEKEITETGGTEFKELQQKIESAAKQKGSETNAVSIAALQGKLGTLFTQKVSEVTRTRWHEVTNMLREVHAEIDAIPKPKVTFAGAVHHGSGTFRGTGPDGGKPRPIYLLARGDVRKPGKVMAPGALSAVTPIAARFDLQPDAPESARRAALAEWLTDGRNPLTWRSIVNRMWLYHFGRGIVETPNDFGRMGSRPSHPELLDWLSVEFRDGGQSLKKLHKLIVTSAAYRQSSFTPAGARANEIDGDNRLLWRMNRRKLEAEAIRDSMLYASGRINFAMYGPGFQDFVIEKPEHSPHYQYHLYDPDDLRSDRRSIYRFIVRSQQQPFMTVLDCADPSMSVEKRNESVSALQALALLNNGFVVSMSRSFAQRLEGYGKSMEDKIEQAYWLALGRAPTDAEARDLAKFAREHGLENACRLIFNLNEFMFAD